VLKVLSATLVALVIGMVAGPRFIRWLSRRGIGQNIRELGPEGHSAKAGTPTMGGLLLLAATLIPYLIFATKTVPTLVVMILALGGGVIGFADDFISQWRQRSLGLSARFKLLLMVPVFGVALWLATEYGGVDTRLSVPFVRDGLEIGWLYYIFAFLFIVGFTNAVNLTDGLDGLAIGPAITCFMTYLLFAYFSGNIKIATYLQIPYVAGTGELAIFCGAVVGAGIGFLWYNTYPAQVFMGDVGSLSLGGSLGALAILTKQEILLAIVGGIFVLETFSVIFQVGWFKLSGGKRIFKMAPIHHHFELKGWPEPKVIVRFWIISILLALVAISTLKLR